MKRKGGGNGDSTPAADLAARLAEHEQALVTARERTAALTAQRDEAVDRRDEAGTDQADRALMLSCRELEAIERGVKRLTEQLHTAREREELAGKHAFLERVRALAAEGVAKAARRVACSARRSRI